MPWSTNADLPEAIRSSLPESAQTRFRTVANDAMNRGADDKSAIKQAWHVVGLGWRKPDDGSGTWLRKAAQSLYVSRPVVNAEDIIKWAKEQGIEKVVPADQMHVTVAYSKTPVEWDSMGAHYEEVVVKTSGRKVAELGDEGAIVLHFKSKELGRRWNEMVQKGASWEHEGFNPHITLTYHAPDGIDLSKIKPYEGPIHLGAEKFAPVEDNWSDNVTEKFMKGCVTKYDENLGLVFGWAIVCKQNGEPYFDLQGDHIPEDAMLKAAADFMSHSRTAKEMHAGDPVGSVVFAFPLTEDIAKSMDIGSKQTGFMIAMKPTPEIVAKFKSGEYTGFSIGGKRLQDEKVAD